MVLLRHPHRLLANLIQSASGVRDDTAGLKVSMMAVSVSPFCRVQPAAIAAKPTWRRERSLRKRSGYPRLPREFSVSAAVMIPDEDRQIVGRRHKGHLVHHVADKTAVIGTMIDDMQHDLLTGHGSLPTTDKFKMNDFRKVVIQPCVDQIDIPAIHFLHGIP